MFLIIKLALKIQVIEIKINISRLNYFKIIKGNLSKKFIYNKTNNYYMETIDFQGRILKIKKA
jgi:hypothetical protein